MTKYRPPSSFESALHRIADQLGGFDALAAAAERQVSTVRMWANVDQPESVPATVMLKLDLAHRAAGGIGSPLRDAYDVMFDTASAQAFGDQIELSLATADAMKEFGDVGHALILAAQPGACDAVLARAEHEAEESLTTLTRAQSIVRDLRKRLRRRPASSAQPALPP